jgi:hypothetical protein
MNERDKRLVLQGIVIGAHVVWRLGEMYGNVGARISNYADALAGVWGVDHTQGLSGLCAEVRQTLDIDDAPDPSRLPEHNN